MPQLETAIVGKNNTKAAVTGQNELLVKVSAVSPGTGLATEGTLQSVDTNTLNTANNTSPNARKANMIRPNNASGNVSSTATYFYSVSVANVGSADGSVLGVTIKPGEVLNFSADALNNYFTDFAYDATGTEFIIIFVTD